MVGPRPHLAREAIINDALALYFADVTLASAFVTRWCAAQRAEVVDGVYRVRENEPTPRIGAGLHKTPEIGSVFVESAR